MDEPIVWYEGAGVSDRRWLIADERGSVVAVTNASGAATSINTYDEYGAPGASNVGRFQYTGQMWLPEAQLYHYRARAYVPALGRFAQPDPIGFAGGMNLYAYVGNDPVNFADPLGLQEKEDKIVPGDTIVVTATPPRHPSLLPTDPFRPNTGIGGGVPRTIRDSVGTTAEAEGDTITVTARRPRRARLVGLSLPGGNVDWCFVAEGNVGIGADFGLNAHFLGLNAGARADVGSGNLNFRWDQHGLRTHGANLEAFAMEASIPGLSVGGHTSREQQAHFYDRDLPFQQEVDPFFAGLGVGGAFLVRLDFKIGFERQPLGSC